IAVSPDSRFAYVAVASTGDDVGGGVDSYSVDTSGRLTLSSPAIGGDNGRVPSWIALSPSGQFAYVADPGAGTDLATPFDSIYVHSINTTNGQLSVGSDGAQGSAAAVTIDAAGRFAYVLGHRSASSTDWSIATYSLEAATGALQFVGATTDALQILATA